MAKKTLIARCKMGVAEVLVYSMPASWGRKNRLDGLCKATNKGFAVFLDGSMAPEKQKETLVHELTHAASGVGGLDLSEQTVTTLSALLAQAFSTLIKL
jgi:hypothetical protein